MQPLPIPDEEHRMRFLEKVAKGNTGTYGVIDQRVVDFLSVVLHPGTSGVFRGLGSSVNETNLAAAKFGDVEYMDVEKRVIFAYEAHGGLLSDAYVDDHIATLKRTIIRRADDLEAIEEAGKWEITVMFIDHGNQPLENHHDREQFDLGEGFRVTMRYMTYEEVYKLLGGPAQLAKEESSFNRYVHGELDSDIARPFIRKAYRSMIENGQ